MVGLVVEHDPASGPGQLDGGGKAGEARADNVDGGHARAAAQFFPPSWPGRRAKRNESWPSTSITIVKIERGPASANTRETQPRADEDGRDKRGHDEQGNRTNARNIAYRTP
jgi:hypothetical protein